MADVTEHKLARTIEPYRGLVAILVLISVVLAVAAFRAREWQIFEAVALVWILSVPVFYIGLQYKVFWSDRYVGMGAFGRSSVKLQYSAIKEVILEKSISKGRPFRRITIYCGDQSSEVIDVSLKHFSTADIRLLMQEIHRKRPDLNLPDLGWKVDHGMV